MLRRSSHPAIKDRVLIIILIASIAAGGCSLLRDSGRAKPHALTTVTTYTNRDTVIGEPFGIAIRDDEVFISDGAAGAILKLNDDGSTAVVASGLKAPSGIAFLPDGDLIVADTGSHTIKRVRDDGTITILAGVENVAGSDDGAGHAATFNGPIGIAADDKGNVYVADTYNDRIRIVERHGVVGTVAGSSRGFADGGSSVAKFDTPLGIALWHDKLLVADSGNRRIRGVETNGDVWTLAGTGDADLRDATLTNAAFVSPTAIAIDNNDAIFVADGNAIRVIGRHAFPYVETIAGDRRGYIDGEAARARFNRPSGLAAGAVGEIIVADSDNRAVRVLCDGTIGRTITGDELEERRITAADFRALQPPRGPYDPPDATPEIAGTLGEIRGEIGESQKAVWFHNGLDIAGGYGQLTRFIRGETVLDPHAVQNFDTARELIRLPTMGYIHLRLGRDRFDTPFGDERFYFERDVRGDLSGLRVRRGAVFGAGDIVGTLNSQNHVHLIAGPPGAEMNALAALALPGVSDSIAPVIEKVELLDESWNEIRAVSNVPQVTAGTRLRVVVDAYDRMDGNAERRRLGVYRLGYQVLSSGTPIADVDWTIVFDRMPSNDAVTLVYAPGSRSGATGKTTFRYIVTNRVSGDNSAEAFLDTATLGPGTYAVTTYAADYFGNISSKDVIFKVVG